MGKWIGVDFDKTLAVYHKGMWPKMGEPIKPMVDRVKKWLSEGKDVRIFTARITRDKNQIKAIQDWCKKYIGQSLPVTNIKDHDMKELWDDKAIAVEPNTGKKL